MSRGNTLSAVPIFLPADPAIPVEGVPAEPQFERQFVADHEILQREQKDAAGWLTAFAYLVVASIAFALLVLIAWALHRLAVASDREEHTAAGTEPRPAKPAERPASTAGPQRPRPA